MREKTKYIQISNIALQTTRDQMVKLFGYIGKVEEIYLYPTVRSVGSPITSRICYIKFKESESVKVALQLTNQVFIDRALLVLPYYKSKIPDETEAITMLMNSSGIPGLDTGPAWPEHIKNEVDGVVLRTEDPALKENGLPSYPNLPATTDSSKVNEIRRTLVFDNIHPDVSSEDVLEFAQKAGEIKFLRMGVEKDGTKNCLVEYAEQQFIIEGLKLHDQLLGGLPVIVNHSTVAIHKFQHKSKEASQKEIDLELEKVNTANSMLTPGLNPLDVFEASLKLSTSPIRSRSRSVHSRDKSASRTSDRKRSHSRKRSRSRKSRSRSSDRRRRSSRSRHRSSTPKPRRSRSKSRDRKKAKSSKDVKKKGSEDEVEKSRSRSRSKGRHRSSSKSRTKRSRSRSRHRSRRNRSRSRSRARKHRRRTPERRKRSISASRSRSRTPKRRHRSRSRDRHRHAKSSRSERKSRDRSRDRKHKRRASRSRDRSKSRDRKRRSKYSRSSSADRKSPKKSHKSSEKKADKGDMDSKDMKSPKTKSKEPEIVEMSVDMDLCDSS